VDAPERGSEFRGPTRLAVGGAAGVHEGSVPLRERSGAGRARRIQRTRWRDERRWLGGSVLSTRRSVASGRRSLRSVLCGSRGKVLFCCHFTATFYFISLFLLLCPCNRKKLIFLT